MNIIKFKFQQTQTKHTTNKKTTTLQNRPTTLTWSPLLEPAHTVPDAGYQTHNLPQ